MASFITVSALALQGGCILPLAIIPVPSVGSGEVVEFRDVNGELIHVDGLLIVHRMRHHDFCMAHFDECPSNQVTSVKNGKAKIPFDMVIHTAGLTPNEVSIVYGLAGFFAAPLFYIPLSPIILPMMAIPVPFANPSEHVYYIPLISGYHVSDDQGYLWDRVWSPQSRPVSCWPYVRDGSIRMCANSSAPAISLLYWREVRDRLRLRFRTPKFDEGPDLRLEYYHYHKVRAFVERELKRIEALPAVGDEPTSGLATQPAS